ncbi:glycosyltransferase [Paenibacillus filicis]|uniref:Glycosyltransferase n=1 Tax=Paenibacillus filicis TaxID=669464 RepID=A0ABU9DQE0_9BACL
MIEIKTAVFTIVSKNYLAFARTLMDSVKNHHPEWEQFVLLVDEPDGVFNYDNEKFQVKFMADINLPNFKKFVFRYNILELNTAVKPWMFYWLFNQQNFDKVYYIDPDIHLYDKMSEVDEALDSGKLMVLTPHLSDFLDDDLKPSELQILQAGTYNLGFLAVSKHQQTNKFLDWWKGKLEYDCTVDIPNGLFVDQKWMDLVPGFFEDILILHHVGYNVAYWNLKHRSVIERQKRFFVNDKPLIFFHFSGVNPLDLSILSKHQNRFTLKNIGDAAQLVEEYAKNVRQNGHEQVRQWTYYYNYFQQEKKIKISDFARISYRNNATIQHLCGENPFEKAEYFLNTQARDKDSSTSLPLITHVMLELWQSRHDLKNVFPDIWGKDRVSFCQWFIDSAEREYGFSNEYITPVKQSLIVNNSTDVTQVADEHSNEVISSTQPVGGLKLLLNKKLYATAVTLKPYLIKYIPSSQKEKLKRFKEKMQRAAYPASVSPVNSKISPTPVISEEYQPNQQGINLIGYSRSETGVGESCRLAARALHEASMPFGIINYDYGNPARSTDTSWISREIEGPSYNVNIFHINADQIPVAYDYLSSNYFASRYNIGYWHWELPDFPDEWKGSFQYLDEIWVPSQFIMDSISAKSPIPVVKIPHGIQVDVNNIISRDHFKLPNESFLFLTMYDMYSFQERKNPNAVINAFKLAFEPTDTSVGLIVKVNHGNSNPDLFHALLKSIESYRNIYVINETFSRADVNALINNSDCFISLHRSEGFGLGLAEAMYLGKPVIGTNWSANVDFMNYKNSCVVDYKLIELGQDYGPYKAYQHWADPDIEHASYYMRKLVSDKQFYQDIAIKGQETIRKEFSPIAVGMKAKNRLKHLGLL